MKIYFSSIKRKKYLRKRSRRSFNERKRFSYYKRSHNIQNNLPNVEKRKREILDKFRDFKKIWAPPILSFIKAPNPVSKFIGQLRECFESRRKVFVVLSGVKEVDYDALVVLLSIMVRFKSQGIEFNGDFPLEKNSAKKLQESGFLPNVYKKFPDEERYKLGKLNSLHTHAWKHVDSELGQRIVSKASEAIWKEKRRCQGVQRTLLELMQNTNNHATIGRSGERHWWLSVNHLPIANKVCFSFVDYGVGVFKSLESKTPDSKFFGWFNKLAAKFKFSSNSELLRLILEGKLHETVTGEYYRGKGLPGIVEALKRNQISNLHVITNDVFANVDKGYYSILDKKFEGTFIYWELNKQNKSCRAES